MSFPYRTPGHVRSLWLGLGAWLCLLPGTTSAQTCATDRTCGFNTCRSPAFTVPSELWGELAPATPGQLPSLRDNTSWNEFIQPPGINRPNWMSLDVENGWIFAAASHGLQVWDGRARPDRPRLRASIGQNVFPTWSLDPHELYPLRDLDAPPGNDRVVAIGLASQGGFAVFDTSAKTAPVAKYADRTKTVEQVYAGRIRGIDYAFSADLVGGLLAYNLSRASALPAMCREITPNQQLCNVYVGRLGTRANFSYVDGVASTDGQAHWVVASSGGRGFGLEIWNVSTPTSPQLALAALGNEFVHGVALWRVGASYYLAVRPATGTTGDLVRIYNVSCLATGGCSSLPAPLWSLAVQAQGAFRSLTFSTSGTRNFLHLGSNNSCASGPQAEWLLDVTSPAAPRDITPPAQLVSGELTGYWGWYYRRNLFGFNRVATRAAKFQGPYLYRAAFSLFDVHRLTTPP